MRLNGCVDVPLNYHSLFPLAGDLWSYNSEHDAFVVSPEPDICCRLLDPTSHRCIVVASDGLWNMIQAQGALDCVYQQEEINKMV